MNKKTRVYNTDYHGSQYRFEEKRGSIGIYVNGDYWGSPQGERFIRALLDDIEELGAEVIALREQAGLSTSSHLYRGIESLIGKLEAEKEPVCKGCQNKIGTLFGHPSGYCYTCYRKIKDAGGNPD